jgi:penicillin amidase
MRIGKRILVAVAVVVVLNLVAATVVFFWFTRRAHPRMSGEIVVEGIDAPVEVLRDENGVPHIYAETTRDLYFAQGFVHAQDRFWQMEFWRRAGSGRLSELLGAGALSNDTFLRTMGFTEIAEQEYELLSDDVRRALDAYAQGVNAYIEDRSPGELSLEHGLLALQGVDVDIEPWRPVHTLTWLKIMSYDLGQNLQTELDTLRLIRAVGTDLAAEYFPEYRDEMPRIVSASEMENSVSGSVGAGRGSGTKPGIAGRAGTAANPAPAGAPASGTRTAETSYRRTLAALAAALHSDDAASMFVGGAAPPSGVALGSGHGLGSNSWVVDGSLTVSGMPILANDPHLGIQMPSIWYEVGLHSEEENLNVAGYSFAGAPGVIIGHNDHVGWGVTNLAPDVQDVYLERINPADPTEYRVGNEWRDMEIRTEVIEVAGRSTPEVIRVRKTRHGPIITDLSSNSRFRGFGIDVPRVAADGLTLTELSLRWTALEPNRTMESVHRLNRATNFEEFRDAVSLFDVPSQNFVYADTEGNIGYQAPGLIPVRRNGTGRLPAPGWTDDYEWEGYIPFEELPYALNPEKGYIATANNAVAPEDYPHLIATEFNHGYRARRIVDMIETLAGEGISVEDIERMHGDTYNISAEEVLPYLAEVDMSGDVPEATLPEEAPEVAAVTLERAKVLLLSWNRRMERKSAGATLYALFFQNLVEAVFLDQVPQDLWMDSSRFTEGSRVQSVIAGLLERPDSVYWDDLETPDRRETRDDILRRALFEALIDGASLFDAPASEWRWSEIHTAEFRHQTLGESGVGIIEWLFNRGPVGVAGGMEQVLSADWNLSEPYEVSILSSMRQILDFSDLDASRMIHTTGQSGHPFHRHYDDMIEPWADVAYHPHRFSREAVEAGRVHRLTLEPAR